MLWAGIDSQDELSVLQQKIVNVCVPFGFKAEDRPYRPHITLARRWNGTEAFAPPDSPFGKSPLQVEVKEVILYRSHPDRTPKYEPIKRLPLG